MQASSRHGLENTVFWLNSRIELPARGYALSPLKPVLRDSPTSRVNTLPPSAPTPPPAGSTNLTSRRQGLMFSAASDLSIVTWYPPRETFDTAAPLPLHAASAAAQAAHAASTSPHKAAAAADSSQQGGWHHQRDHSGSTEAPSPAILPPPSPSATSTPAPAPATAPAPASAPAAAAVGDNDGDERAGVAHDIDPGVVVHAAGVVGMIAVPGGVISADQAGKVLERGPKRLIGK